MQSRADRVNSGEKAHARKEEMRAGRGGMNGVALKELTCVGRQHAHGLAVDGPHAGGGGDDVGVGGRGRGAGGGESVVARLRHRGRQFLATIEA